jgi:myosin heavy subunit
MADINQTNVSYVRCIKPNPNKSPGKIVHKPILKYILINLYKPYSV